MKQAAKAGRIAKVGGETPVWFQPATASRAKGMAQQTANVNRPWGRQRGQYCDVGLDLNCVR